MTPREIFEYKQQWRPNSYSVRVHSDLHIDCKDWCRRNCARESWSMDTYTNVYEHTFRFEHDSTARDFENQFKRWIQP